MQKIKKPISILLSVLMVLSVFAVVPFTASAASTGSITTSAVNNGTLTADKESASENDTVTLTAVPDGSYVTCKVGAYTKSESGVTPALTAISGDKSAGDKYSYANLFAANDNKWYNAVNANTHPHVIFKASSPIVMTGYSLKTGNDNQSYHGRNWKDYTIYGANFSSDSCATKDAGAWQPVVTVTNDTVTQDVNFATYNYPVTSATVPYQYYMIVITASKGDGGIQMTEFKMTGDTYSDLAPVQSSEDTTKYSFSMPASDVIADASFDAPPVASVTSGGTTTEYSDFATAVTNWNSAANGATLTLLADVQMGSPVNVSGTRTLDLNGYGIKVTVVNQTVFNVSGNLTLNDSDATKIHKFDPPSGTAGLATLNEESGSLEIHGGYITGFKGKTLTYLFNVPSSGSFTINGGNLIGNEGTQKVSYNGTVVISASGDLTINGGAIIYNKSGYWGTAISASGILKINGGTIAHNYAAQSTAGIFCWYLEMTGGSVTDNVAATTGQSAGITFAYDATFSGNPVIKDNTDSTGASNLSMYFSDKYSKISSNLGENACIGITMSNPGVFTDSSDTSFNDPTKFFSDKSNYIVGKNAAGQLLLGVPRTVTWKMDDGSVIDTTTVANGCAPTHDDPTKADDDNTYTFTGWTPALAPVTADATYTATYTATPYVASVTSNGTTTKYTDFGTAVSNWTDGSTLTLLANVTTSSVIYFESGNKTLDLNGKTITMTGNDCILYVNGGSLTVNGNGGTLTGGKGGLNYGDSYRRGGAIDLKSGSVVLDNCNITNNTSSFGSAVFMAGSTVLTIQNGTAITNNVGGNAVLWVQGGTVNMTGGTISNNSATAVSMYSNNWYSDLARFNMSGGTISNNTGSGVAFSGNQTGQCSVSGNAVIKDNTSANLNLSGSVLLNVNGELGDDASIGITKNPGVFTNSTDTSFIDASKFFSDNVNYKVVKNAAGQLELKPALFVGHSISLNGDVTLNFFINPKAKGVNNFNNYKNAKVTFTWDKGQGQEYGTKSVNLLDPEDENVSVDPTTGYYKVSCNVAAAHMGHKVLAELYLDTTEPVETNAYSVREYAEIIWKNPSQYDTKNKPTELQNLVQAMLNYGAMAQLAFQRDLADDSVELANSYVGENGYKNVTSDDIAAKIKPGASDLKEVATKLSAKYYTTSLLYLSQNKLRVYFTPTTYPGQIPKPEGFTDNKAGYYYYKESDPIAAADLDEQQKLSVNGVDFYVSALDYAKVIVENKNNQMNETQINLAKALFLYNQAANAYFV